MNRQSVRAGIESATADSTFTWAWWPTMVAGTDTISAPGVPMVKVPVVPGG